MSELWQKLVNNVSQQNQQKETVQPTQPTIDLIGQGQSVEQILNQNQPSVFVGIPTEVTIEEDEDDVEDIPFEEGVDDPNQTNSFSLGNLLNPALVTPPSTPQLNTDIFSMLGGQPLPPQQIVNEPVATPKRGRGRPPLNKAQDLINKLQQTSLNTEQDQFKSSENDTEKSTQIKQTTKDVAVALPKQTLREIGESLQRIGAACISVANS